MIRRLPTARLLLLITVVIAALTGGAVIALAAIRGSGPTPPPKPLDAAIHDALGAPPVPGVTARIKFTNHLIDKSSLPGASNPLLSGATGRLWAAVDGRVRLELQSDNGDAQVVSDGNTVTVLDGTQNVAYKITLPAHHDESDNAGAGGHGDRPPSLAQIDDVLSRIGRSADLSGATPSNVAGREAYTVRVAPKHDGGLIGAAELAWDAANGIPLRAAIYAAGDSQPVLELRATDISFHPVAAGDLQAAIPPGVKVTTIDLRGHHDQGDRGGDQPDITGPRAVAAQLPFKLSAPDTLVGLPRHDVRFVSSGEDKGALVTYGKGLGGIAVLELAAPRSGVRPTDGGHEGDHGDHQLSLPKVSIDGASGEELATALGTMVRFQRAGVQYIVIGSVPPSAAEAAARAL